MSVICERSEAISFDEKVDCFVALLLAMTTGQPEAGDYLFATGSHDAFLSVSNNLPRDHIDNFFGNVCGKISYALEMPRNKE